MKAVRTYVHAGPGDLMNENVAMPNITKGEALVKVYAAGITPTEFM